MTNYYFQNYFQWHPHVSLLCTFCLVPVENVYMLRWGTLLIHYLLSNIVFDRLFSPERAASMAADSVSCWIYTLLSVSDTLTDWHVSILLLEYVVWIWIVDRKSCDFTKFHRATVRSIVVAPERNAIRHFIYYSRQRSWTSLFKGLWGHCVLKSCAIDKHLCDIGAGYNVDGALRSCQSIATKT